MEDRKGDDIAFAKIIVEAMKEQDERIDGLNVMDVLSKKGKPSNVVIGNPTGLDDWIIMHIAERGGKVEEATCSGYPKDI